MTMKTVDSANIGWRDPSSGDSYNRSSHGETSPHGNDSSFGTRANGHCNATGVVIGGMSNNANNKSSSKHPNCSNLANSNAKCEPTISFLPNASDSTAKFIASCTKTSEAQPQQQQLVELIRTHRESRSLSSVSLPDILHAADSGMHQLVGFPRTATTNDSVSVIGVRNGFLTNLSQQMRAVSSPSLTDMGDHCQRVPSSSSSYTNNATTQTASQEDCCRANTTNNVATSAPVVATQNVGVLQKFKRTLTNFNKHQHQQQQQQSSNQAATHGGTSAAASSSSSSQNPSGGDNNCCNTTTATMTTTTSASGTFLMPDTEMSTDVTDSTSNKYRFGPLVWRSSKERRKTKYNRRDKCNSGDSGIQIELENDEQFARALAANGGSGGCLMMNGSLNTSNGVTLMSNGRKSEGLNSLRFRQVRRTNSAKVTSMTDQSVSEVLNKAKMLKRMDINGEREAPESLPTRSLSQPNGLESCGMTRNDLDDSDSDSVTSHEEAPSCYYPIYAEVLYNFTAAGPQELGLEKGTLIEILRKEIGPWWFGRIKKEDASLVEEILDPELGWFPKEFVRVIHSPETDAFFLRHLADEEQRHKDQHINHMQINELSSSTIVQQTTTTTSSSVVPAVGVDNQMLLNTSSSAPCTPVNTSSEDNCNTTIIDKHNVTTIVIETSSPPSTALLLEQQSSERTMDQDEQQQQQQRDASSTTTTTLTANGQTVLSTSQSLNVIMGSTEILRRSAVKELLDTEVNYVKLLQAICEGYLPAMSKRIDIFSPNSIRLIFSNITAIYKFQRRFLEALRKGIEQNQVGKIFLKMHKGFLCYSTYCNSYPRALIELESYERVKDARTILDNCRESENLAELPLSAHLLAPVQRICRYPLHLAEIMKTSAKGSEPTPFSLQEFEQIDVSQLDIPDTTETIDMALEAMKSITEAVNEGKRHSETIARHQASFQNFKGPPLHLHSTRFFVQIDATRQKQNLWNSSCTLFLFDNQLVYCKRDIIKRSNFIYKGRIFLDRCRVVNVRDGKMFGHTIKNSLRIYCESRGKWFDFSFRSANRKHRFLNTLALERQFSGKSLYISEMMNFDYAFEERDCSDDQSDYEGAENEQQKLKEFLYEANLNNGNNTNTSGESSVPESPAKSFKYSDTLPKKSSHRLESTANNETQTGSLGRRRLGNWFRKPKSTASTPNQSPTHKSHPPAAHSTGDLQLSGTSDINESYTVLEHADNGGVSS
ncbi:uncharacterized protein LOC131800713 isoform X3 [Musca domestica]|uniref:Uncharacterized protein LOC131800713 isoform X3 n=1 Tax=Musca domestica TaxID=7370 RepID=A0ABM3ULG4_MUSDO|nr:uncharacterized protein LOC131800713 isoform X3 [Musca domestica]